MCAYGILGRLPVQNYMVTEDGEVQWTAKRTRQMLADYGILGTGLYKPGYQCFRHGTAQELSSGKPPWCRSRMLSRIEDLNWPQIHLGFSSCPAKTDYGVQDRNVEWGYPRPRPGAKEKMEAAERSEILLFRRNL